GTGRGRAAGPWGRPGRPVRSRGRCEPAWANPGRPPSSDRSASGSARHDLDVDGRARDGAAQPGARDDPELESPGVRHADLHLLPEAAVARHRIPLLAVVAQVADLAEPIARLELEVDL